VALIAGIDVPGYMIAFQIQITFEKSRTPPIQYQVWPISCATQLLAPYCAIGETDVSLEYATTIGPKTVPELGALISGKAFSPTFGTADYDILRAIRLVDLTIACHKGNDVGDKIDAVQLSKDGTVRWFARKGNCPAD